MPKPIAYISASQSDLVEFTDCLQCSKCGNSSSYMDRGQEKQYEKFTLRLRKEWRWKFWQERPEYLEVTCNRCGCRGKMKCADANKVAQDYVDPGVDLVATDVLPGEREVVDDTPYLP